MRDDRWDRENSVGRLPSWVTSVCLMFLVVLEYRNLAYGRAINRMITVTSLLRITPLSDLSKLRIRTRTAAQSTEKKAHHVESKLNQRRRFIPQSARSALLLCRGSGPAKAASLSDRSQKSIGS